MALTRQAPCPHEKGLHESVECEAGPQQGIALRNVWEGPRAASGGQGEGGEALQLGKVQHKEQKEQRIPAKRGMVRGFGVDLVWSRFGRFGVDLVDLE